jgi:predicted O-linked N-acetylglucosamine transferase (SPINDLY family)
LSQGRARDALPYLERAIAGRPRDPDAHYALGVALHESGQLDRAIAAFEATVRFGPRHADGWLNLGSMLRAARRIPEAVAAYRKAIAVRPDDRAWSNLVYALQYDPTVDAKRLFAEHQAFGRRFPAAPPMPRPAPDNVARRLKIGYVSADFGSHPVGFFLLPVFAHHDRARFEVVAYSGRKRPDDVTRRLATSADRWVETATIDDDKLRAMIVQDRIDLLVDLSGHTRGHRLGVFARRAAPVQITWAGYVGTTGVSAIDWLLADHRHMPPGSEPFAVERIHRLPRSYITWEPPTSPEPGPLPMLRDGARGPVLGSMNQLAKLSDPVVDLWSQILSDHPTATLLLVTRGLSDSGTVAAIRALFHARGVDPSRLDLRGFQPRDELMRIYRDELDLALDPFPYSGGLTTLEALWQGVPVVALGDGDRFAARHSAAHLGAMGLDTLVARDRADYRQKVSDLLADPPALARLRADLRPRMAASVLCDGPGFTRELEAAFLAMWAARPGAQETTPSR